MLEIICILVSLYCVCGFLFLKVSFNLKITYMKCCTMVLQLTQMEGMFFKRFFSWQHETHASCCNCRSDESHLVYISDILCTKMST